MVKASKELKGNVLTVKLTGSIEEAVDFEQLIGTCPAELKINCREVSRINSAGIKAWIRYFQGITAKGTSLTFLECSTAIVDQINLISNFVCGGKVESMVVPFACPKCKDQISRIFGTEQLQKLEFNLPEVRCSKCGVAAVFDDIPEKYFDFLAS